MPPFIDELFIAVVCGIIAPLFILGGFLLIFIVLAPSRIHQEQQTTMSTTEEALAQEKTRSSGKATRKVSIVRVYVEQGGDKAEVFLDVENTGELTNKRTRVQIKDCVLLDEGTPNEWRKQLNTVYLSRKLPNDVGKAAPGNIVSFDVMTVLYHGRMFVGLLDSSKVCEVRLETNRSYLLKLVAAADDAICDEQLYVFKLHSDGRLEFSPYSAGTVVRHP